ncbi:MAG: hypothetical protein K8F91_25030, partial [Candidatus Obscuribacterales bacterium]|nr:hypothetical protein [Candidatus Obscuribacterales bacterium]
IRGLQNLHLGSSGFQAKNLDKLPSSRHYLTLDLANLALHDQDMKPIAKLQAERLNLSFNKITDQTLAFLEQARSLKVLVLTGCQNLTPAGIGRFQQRRPDCRLVLKHENPLAKVK